MTMTILVGNYRWGDREEALSLADALDRGNVYKGGLHTCRHCLAAIALPMKRKRARTLSALATVWTAARLGT